MSTLNNAERSKARAALIKAGVPTRGMTDEQLKAAYEERQQPAPVPEPPQWATPAPEDTPTPTPAPTPTPEQEAPAMPQAQSNTDQIAQQIAALLAGAQQPAPEIDEKRLIELIKEHSTISLEVTPRPDRAPVRIEGAHQQLDTVVTWLSTGTNVYLQGPAGSGKTTLAEQAAKALDTPFYSSGAIMASYELLGVRNAHGEYIATPLRKAYEEGGVFLLDEIDGCSPRALICFNQLLANNTFCFPDGMVTKHPDFVAVGGANTTGQGATRQYVGRAQLDAATLDRFIQIDVGYDEQLERRMSQAEYKAHGGTDDATLERWINTVQDTRAKLERLNIPALVTPRASLHGARGLAKGLEVEQLADSILKKHLSEDQIQQVRNA